MNEAFYIKNKALSVKYNKDSHTYTLHNNEIIYIENKPFNIEYNKDSNTYTLRSILAYKIEDAEALLRALQGFPVVLHGRQTPMYFQIAIENITAECLHELKDGDWKNAEI